MLVGPKPPSCHGQTRSDKLRCCCPYVEPHLHDLDKLIGSSLNSLQHLSDSGSMGRDIERALCRVQLYWLYCSARSCLIVEMSMTPPPPFLVGELPFRSSPSLLSGLLSSASPVFAAHLVHTPPGAVWHQPDTSQPVSHLRGCVVAVNPAARNPLGRSPAAPRSPSLSRRGSTPGGGDLPPTSRSPWSNSARGPRHTLWGLPSLLSGLSQVLEPTCMPFISKALLVAVFGDLPGLFQESTFPACCIRQSGLQLKQALRTTLGEGPQPLD